MSDVECTAVRADGKDPFNFLMEPPCSCPNCAPVPFEPGPTRRDWLRVRGRQQRLRVERVELGPTGQSILG